MTFAAGATFVLLVGLFLLPTIIACHRGRQPTAIMLLNLTLGWTGIFWLLALIWAVSDGPRDDR
jgi:hypothetical protein